MSNETKVGFFLLAALGVILSSVLFLGKIELFKRTKTYYLEFANVEALPPKAAVKVAGVEIGKVKSVTLVKGKAVVRIEIDPDVPVYANAVVRIGSTGIIGTRFVELNPGTPDTAELPAGSTLRGTSSASLETMMSNISSLFNDDPVHGNASDNLKATLANIRRVSDALNVALGQRSKDLEAIVVNIRELTESAKVFAKDLEEISTERKDDVKIALDKFRGVSEKLDNILAKIDRGEGTLGTLISDKKTADDMKEAISSVKDTAAGAKKVIGRFTMLNTYWNYRYRYDTRDDEGRSDIGITLVPQPGKFYAVGATNVGKPISNEKHLEFERKNRITAVIGSDFGPFTGYAGAIRSAGGVGLNFRPLFFNKKLERRVEMNVEAADFSRDRVVRGHRLDRAWVGAGMHMALNRWLWVGARGEDLLERAAFMAYTNIVFRDEDLSYLFGFAGLAR